MARDGELATIIIGMLMGAVFWCALLLGVLSLTAPVHRLVLRVMQ